MADCSAVQNVQPFSTFHFYPSMTPSQHFHGICCFRMYRACPKVYQWLQHFQSFHRSSEKMDFSHSIVVETEPDTHIRGENWAFVTQLVRVFPAVSWVGVWLNVFTAHLRFSVSGASRKDQPSFTLKQVSFLCERLLKDHEEKIREEYEQILNTKLAGNQNLGSRQRLLCWCPWRWLIYLPFPA